MSHALKKYARAVQKALIEDPELARPPYQWCLSMIETHYTATSGTHEQRLAQLLEKIRPHARKKG